MGATCISPTLRDKRHNMTDGPLKFPQWQAPLQDLILEFDPVKLPEKNRSRRSPAVRAPSATEPRSRKSRRENRPAGRPFDRTHHEARPPRSSPIRIAASLLHYIPTSVLRSCSPYPMQLSSLLLRNGLKPPTSNALRKGHCVRTAAGFSSIREQPLNLQNRGSCLRGGRENRRTCHSPEMSRCCRRC